MNQDMILSLIRVLLQVLGTSLVAKGVISSDQLATLTTTVITLVGALLVAVPTIWGVFSHTDSAKVAAVQTLSPVNQQKVADELPDATKINAVAALPDVKKIIVAATATNGVAKAAADPAQPKVVTQ